MNSHEAKGSSTLKFRRLPKAKPRLAWKDVNLPLYMVNFYKSMLENDAITGRHQNLIKC